MDNRYLELYTHIYPVENAKSRDGVQFEGRCPFHDDHNNSFGYRTDTGVCNCFVGCISGGAYDYSIKRGMAEIEARKYFVNFSNEIYTSPKPNKEKSPPTLSLSQLDSKAKQYIKNLQHIKNPSKELIQRLDLIGENGIKEFALGVDNNKALTVPYINQNGVIEGIYHHDKQRRPYVDGDGRNRWYPMHKIFDYDRDKWFYGVEGELDAIVGWCNGLQTFTSTTGALSIPMKVVEGKKVEDLDIVLHCNKGIRIVKDNDDSGRKGGRKLAELIKEKLQPHKIILGKYREDLKNGYDLSDAFMDDPMGGNFFDAIDRGEEIQIKKQTEEQNKGFETMSLDKFMSAEFEPQFPLIENIMDKGTISLIAGDEGTGKSWVILSACLSLASGIPLFDFFDIHSSEDYDE